MNAKAETKSISVEFDLPHPPAKVWRALTEPELLAEWLMATDMRTVVGNSFTSSRTQRHGGTGSCTARCWRSIRPSASVIRGGAARSRRAWTPSSPGHSRRRHRVARGSRSSTPASFPPMRSRSTARGKGGSACRPSVCARCWRGPLEWLFRVVAAVSCTQYADTGCVIDRYFPFLRITSRPVTHAASQTVPPA
jgi:hypothetical protein